MSHFSGNIYERGFRLPETNKQTNKQPLGVTLLQLKMTANQLVCLMIYEPATFSRPQCTD